MNAHVTQIFSVGTCLVPRRPRGLPLIAFAVALSLVAAGCVEETPADRADAGEQQRPERYSVAIECSEFTSNVEPATYVPPEYGFLDVEGTELDELLHAVFAGDRGPGTVREAMVSQELGEYAAQYWLVDWPFRDEFPRPEEPGSICHALDVGRSCSLEHTSVCCADTVICQATEARIGVGGHLYRWVRDRTVRRCCSGLECPAACIEQPRVVPEGAPWWAHKYDRCPESIEVRSRNDCGLDHNMYECVASVLDPCSVAISYCASDPPDWGMDRDASDTADTAGVQSEQKQGLFHGGVEHCMNSSRSDLCPDSCRDSSR